MNHTRFITMDNQSDWSTLEKIYAVTMGDCPGARHVYKSVEEIRRLGFNIGPTFIGFSIKTQLVFCETCGSKLT